MRHFTQEYDRVFVDIDDTLIYGLMTNVMHKTWHMFHDSLLSYLLMCIQQKFKLYRVNRKLIQMLKPLRADKTIFLTVRSYCPATEKMIKDIMGSAFRVIALGSDNGALDKAMTMEAHLTGDAHKVLLIDDNKANRETAEMFGFSTFDPTLLLEKVVG